MRGKAAKLSFVLLISAAIFLFLKTILNINDLENQFKVVLSNIQMLQVVDRNGRPLSVSYQNNWNFYDTVPLYEIPVFLKEAFVLSEDHRFYTHHGNDWLAKISAIWQNLKAGHTVRGASTLTEQVVRLLDPRPRNGWSKWLEIWEARRLEQHFSKAALLEFYLNQVPYAGERRGVVQAARYYFDRDLSTLSRKEMLALVVLARSPSRWDLYGSQTKIEPAISRLADRLVLEGKLSTADRREIAEEHFDLKSPSLTVNAAHFVSAVREVAQQEGMRPFVIKTTLDSRLQAQVQHLLDERIKALKGRGVRDGAALVADHTTGEILAWVVARATDPNPQYINAVLTPRQPGSTLKPFLYALALDKGYSPATLIEDAPLSEAVGKGLHAFKNYSNHYYGPISLREALGNSLNIPALKTARFVGVDRYLAALKTLGFNSLTHDPDFYQEGLALGNGEVTLLELVTGYAALANHGDYRPLSTLFDRPVLDKKKVFSAEAASLIGNILSDPGARRLEFGRDSILNLPIQTAVKTGTSTDYRDAWAVGFNYRYVVGIWMGNLDQTPMDGITGGIGPALVLRSVFSLLTQYQETQPLFLSPQLEQREICCPARTEYFMPGRPTEVSASSSKSHKISLAFQTPTEGLQLAIDPRIPANQQFFTLSIQGFQLGQTVEWKMDGSVIAKTETDHYAWLLSPGHHRLEAKLIEEKRGKIFQVPPVHFWVR